MNISKDLVIGVDLGATNIRAGLVEDAKIIKYADSRVPVDSNDANTVIESLKNTIEQVFVSHVKGIGIGIPSLVDRKHGIVYDVQNIPSWKEVYLKSILEVHFKVPVFLDNDCNCFTIGERLYGQGKDYLNFVGITLGTGMGAGIINRGKLINDANCGSGEFGSIPYLNGIYEDYCSGKFFKTFHHQDGEKASEAAKNNEPSALKAYEEFGKHLGNAIKTIMFSVDPEMVILGGSIAKSHQYFEKSMLEEIGKFPYPNSLKKFKVLYSSLENLSILGAAAMFFDVTNNNLKTIPA
ncbi:MAG TPA: sugar kinase [Bacteroidales bacterium]|nr:sugar kinase [Bacteroidales bacterium]